MLSTLSQVSSYQAELRVEAERQRLARSARSTASAPGRRHHPTDSALGRPGTRRPARG